MPLELDAISSSSTTRARSVESSCRPCTGPHRPRVTGMSQGVLVSQPSEFADLDRLRAIYDRHARAFDAHRHRLLSEARWLDRALALAPPQTACLDLGCGAGEPVGRYLAQTGRPLVGVDFSPGMLALARERLQDATFVEMDMRALDLRQRFGLIVAWDSFFHLTPADQRGALARMAAHLVPGGVLLFTCGPRAGEVEGTVEGERVYHASLDPREYASELERHGVEMVDFVAEDPTCDCHSLVLARRGADDSA